MFLKQQWNLVPLQMKPNKPGLSFYPSPSLIGPLCSGQDEHINEHDGINYISIM